MIFDREKQRPGALLRGVFSMSAGVTVSFTGPQFLSVGDAVPVVAARTASSARTEQWSLWAGRPSRASTTARLVSCRASETGLPLIISVAIELVAMALPQPKVLNFTSVITWVSGSTWIYIRMISPHLALPTSPTPSASGSFPTFRGCWKWSITLSLYNAIVIVSSYNRFTVWMQWETA